MLKIKWLAQFTFPAIFCFALGCSDNILDEIPPYEIAEAGGSPIIFMDSILLDDGLLYRKLNENGYSDIYGLAKFTFPKEHDSFAYDILVVSCVRGPDKLRLLITIDKKFNSVKDIYAFNAQQYTLWDLEKETNDPTLFCRILLNAFSGKSSSLVSIWVHEDGKMIKVDE